MEKSIGVTEARTKFSELVDGVRFQGDAVFLVKSGKPAAVMVPVTVYEQWQQQRNERFAVFQRIQDQDSSNVQDGNTLMEYLEEVKHEVRELAQQQAPR